MNRHVIKISESSLHSPLIRIIIKKEKEIFSISHNDQTYRKLSWNSLHIKRDISVNKAYQCMRHLVYIRKIKMLYDNPQTIPMLLFFIRCFNVFFFSILIKSTGLKK